MASAGLALFGYLVYSVFKVYPILSRAEKIHDVGFSIHTKMYMYDTKSNTFVDETQRNF